MYLDVRWMSRGVVSYFSVAVGQLSMPEKHHHCCLILIAQLSWSMDAISNALTHLLVVFWECATLPDVHLTSRYVIADEKSPEDTGSLWDENSWLSVDEKSFTRLSPRPTRNKCWGERTWVTAHDMLIYPILLIWCHRSIPTVHVQVPLSSHWHHHHLCLYIYCPNIHSIYTTPTLMLHSLPRCAHTKHTEIASTDESTLAIFFDMHYW